MANITPSIIIYSPKIKVDIIEFIGTEMTIATKGTTNSIKSNIQKILSLKKSSILNFIVLVKLIHRIEYPHY